MEEKIIATIREIRLNSFQKNVYQHWIAGITNKHRVLLVLAWSKTQWDTTSTLDEYIKIEDASSYLIDATIEEISGQYETILISPDSNIEWKFNSMQVHDNGTKINFTLPRYQLKIIKNMLMKNLSFDEAKENAGPDTSRITAFVLIVLILLLFLVIIPASV